MGVDEHGRNRARLLDLVPGRSGAAYKAWLFERGQAFRSGMAVATLDTFRGYRNTIDDDLSDAVAVLDAFHVVKLGTAVVDDVRRRVQQDTCGHREADVMTRCTGSATSCAPATTASPTANAPGSPRRSPPGRSTSRSRSRGCAPRKSARCTIRTPQPPARPSPRRS